MVRGYTSVTPSSIRPIVLRFSSAATASSLFERNALSRAARSTYREAQVRMLHGDNRPIRNKQLDLFRFVPSKTDPSTLCGRERARVTKELVSEWDQVHLEDTYDGDTRRFWRDYDRAVRLIALPLEAAEQRERKRKPRERLRRRAP